ncbi:class III signal peptide-containing protein [Methanocaldococcus sp.]
MKGQVSLEFSILLLATILFVIIAVGYTGLYGISKVSEVSLMSLAHSALAKLKNDIEIVSVGSINTTLIDYIKTPPGTYSSNGKTIYFSNERFNFTISANCSTNVNIVGSKNIPYGYTIKAEIKKIDDNLVLVNLSLS